MLSILIPTYNYDVTTLVYNLHKQLIKSKIVFEIICLDDVSNEEFIKSNIGINKLPFTTYQMSSKNNGIAITRQLLSKMAKYKWIMLLDADTELRDNNFISTYINAINLEYDVIFGGFAYKNKKPQKDYLLRWKYGKQCEALNADKRNANPYKVTIAANLLIKKETYTSFNLDSIGKQYAMDYYFGALLKESNIPILHIDNQVFHLGIEKSEIYLIKKEKATETLLKLYHSNNIKEHSNDLLNTYIRLKQYKLNYVFATAFKLFKPLLKKNLLSNYPIILLLQFYKISYMCHFELSNKNQ
jgi:Glycosyl transferase family 2